MGMDTTPIQRGKEIGLSFGVDFTHILANVFSMFLYFGMFLDVFF